MLSYVETVDTLRSKHVMLQWFNVDTVDTVVFAAFMQMHTDTQTWCTAYMPLAPPREKALLRTLSCGFSGSPPSSPRMQLCFKNILGLVKTTRVIAGKMHSQFHILKCYDGCSAILYCTLHTLTETATMKFRI